MASVLLLASCSKSDREEKEKFSDALVVAPGAYETQFKKFRGTDQLVYMLKSTYPARGTLTIISEGLRQKGWEPLAESFLNPGTPTSQVRGWTEFFDSTRQPEQKVRQWSCDWRNRSGDLVAYFLEYRYSKDGNPDLQHLQVFGLYVPVNIALEMQRDAERFLRQKRRAR